MAMQPMMHPQQQALQAMVDEDDDNVEDHLVEEHEVHPPAGMAAPAPGPLLRYRLACPTTRATTLQFHAAAVCFVGCRVGGSPLRWSG